MPLRGTAPAIRVAAAGGGGGGGGAGGVGARGYFKGQVVSSASYTQVSFSGSPGVYEDALGLFDIANSQIVFKQAGWWVASINAEFAGLLNDGEVFLEAVTTSSETDENVTTRRQITETHNGYTFTVGPRYFNANETLKFYVTQNGDASDTIDWIVGVASGGGGGAALPLAGVVVGFSAVTGSHVLSPSGSYYTLTNGVLAGLPAGIGLSLSGGVFTATEDGLWLIRLDLATNGSTSGLYTINSSVSSFDMSVLVPTTITNTSCFTAIYLPSGANFQVQQASGGSPIVSAYMTVMRLS